MAEANGLDATAQLVAGQTLEVPQSLESGKIDSDSHLMYNEGAIIGSTTPGLEVDAPKTNWWKVFIALVLVAIVVFIAVVATGGLAGAMLAPNASLLMTIGAYALAGFIVGAIAEAVTIGIMVAFEMREAPDSEQFWKEVGLGALKGAAAGALSGLAKGADAVDKTLTVVELAKTVKFVKTAKIAIEAAQAILNNVSIDEDGKFAIESTSGLLIDLVGVAASNRVGGGAGGALDIAYDIYEKIGGYITPWVKLESYSDIQCYEV